MEVPESGTEPEPEPEPDTEPHLRRVRAALPDAGDLRARIMMASLADRLFAVQQGVQAGRFRILEQLGSGGMGFVYAADDPVLQRRVALKIHRRERHGAREGRERMLSEGRAMARLDHPGVLRVFEVGEIDEQVYVVMELADGGTLDRWLGERPRHLDEILDRFVEAGVGLAVAHEHDLVHRDFKPQNVFIRADGEACVGDFSLVRRIERLDGPTRRASSPVATADHRDLPTTAIGGTPGYMAPEQVAGGPLDARADQYSFCVALYEAITGQRPHAVTSAADDRATVGRKPTADRPRAVPRAVRMTLERGLQLDPRDRFPDMRALLARLRAYRHRGRRRTRALTGLLALTGVGAAVLFATGEVSINPARCDGATEQLQGVWTDTHAAAIRQAFTTSSVANQERAATRVATRLDEYGVRWAAQYQARCEDTRMRGLRSELQFSATVACLSDHLEGMGALIGRLSSADAATVEHALSSVLALPEPEHCGDLDWLRAQADRSPPPPEHAAEVETLHAELHEVRAEIWTGHDRPMLSRARAIDARAAELGFVPLSADAGLVLGSIERRLRHTEQAAAHLEASYLAATKIDDPERACKAAAELVDVTGVWLGRPDEGRLWEKLAKAAHERGQTWACTTRLRQASANLSTELAQYDEALGMLDDALASHPTDDGEAGDAVRFDRIRLHALRGQALLGVGRLEHAERAIRRAIDEAIALLGPGHPRVATLRIALGSTLGSGGEVERAREQFERALADLEASVEPDDPRIAQTLGNLSLTLDMTTEYDRARQLLLRAKAIYDEHPELQRSRGGFIMGSLGNAAFEHGDFARARQHFADAIVFFDRLHGPKNPRSAWFRGNLAASLAKLGSLLEARAEYEQALEDLRVSVGEQHGDYQRMRERLEAVVQRLATRPAVARHPGEREALTR